MDAEWWDRENVKLLSIYAPDVWDWFQQLVGTRQVTESESAASNLLALNPSIICGYPEPSPLWVLREQHLSVKDDEEQTRPDLIIVTPTDVWLVEVKYPYSGASIQNIGNETYDEIVESLVRHKERIEHLGWWADRKKRLRVVWVYDDEAKDRSVADKCRTHIDQALRSIRS